MSMMQIDNLIGHDTWEDVEKRIDDVLEKSDQYIKLFMEKNNGKPHDRSSPGPFDGQPRNDFSSFQEAIREGRKRQDKGYP